MWCRETSLLILAILPLMVVVRVEAGWGLWEAWSDCSVACGGGVMVRNRTCETSPCSGDEVSFSPCNYNDCPEDAVWFSWGSWGACSVSCAGGTHRRSRECDGPYQGGAPCVGQDEETETCNEFNCPINGGWTQWSGFSPCSMTCGGGVREQNRTCTDPAPQNGGWTCPGDENQHEICNTEPCPGSDIVHGNWAPWSFLGDCSTSCGPGVKTRHRTCTNPAPDNGGDTCQGNSTQEFDCSNEHAPCAVDGSWGWWTDWTTCSQSCDSGGMGPGYQSRERYCDNPSPAWGGENCTGGAGGAGGNDWQEQDCGADPCLATDGVWGSWTFIGSCSKTCGGGQRVRHRLCDSPPSSSGGRPCPDADESDPNTQTTIIGCNFNHCPIHGGWTDWSNFTDCSVTCGTGTQTRSRTCTDPAPLYNGYQCEGPGVEDSACVLDECDVDGGWGAWSEYSACSVPCGGGSQMREKWCDSPPPSGNGQPCPGSPSETGACNTHTCPPQNGAWSRWHVWGSCSHSCGGGVRTRIRSCDNPPPANGGNPCPGTSTQAEQCNENTCPPENIIVDGQWTKWSPWSQCSHTCGGGQRRRLRTCTDPAPSGGGHACDDVMEMISRETEIIFCNDNDCPTDGSWSAWSNWTDCSVSCGNGVQTTTRKCDSPAPTNGGKMCLGANSFSVEEFLSQECINAICRDVPLQTPEPGLTRTPSKAGQEQNVSTTTSMPSCPESEAWDSKSWPKTLVGNIVSINCPDPATGYARRKCESSNSWGETDTSDCRSPSFKDLQETVHDAVLNATAREIVLSSFRETCEPKLVQLAGDLLSCKNVFQGLVIMDVLGDQRVSHREKDAFVGAIVDGVSNVVDLGNEQQWYSVVKAEEEDDISILSEFTEGMEELGKQIASHLTRENRHSLCKSAKNIALCVQRLDCSTGNYRYPLPPPDPTPPPKHVRGGWVAEPIPKISYVSLASSLIHGKSCMDQQPNMEPRYAVTVFYSTIDQYLPDENKRAVHRDREDSTTSASVNFGPTRTVLAKVVSTTIVSKTLNTSFLPHPVDITFEHTKGGQDWKCVYLDPIHKKRLYSSEGCHIKSGSDNSTICSCSHMTTFVLLGKQGEIEVFKPSGLHNFILAAGILVIITTFVLIVFYIFIRIYVKDRYFVLLNVYIALLIGHLVHIVGANATNDFHGCRVVVYIVHVCFLSTVVWLLCMAGFLFKQLRDQRALGTRRRLVYSLVGWGLPAVIAAITLGLGHEVYYYDQDVCWMGFHKLVNLSFILPLLVVVLTTIVILAVVYRQSGRLVLDKGDVSPIPGEVDFRNLQSFLRKIIGLVIVMLLLWIVFWAYFVPIIFLIVDLILCGYLLIGFLVMDHDVRRALTKRKAEIEEIRQKYMERPPTPEEPIWVTKMKILKTNDKTAENAKLQETKIAYMPPVEDKKPLEAHTRFTYIPK